MLTVRALGKEDAGTAKSTKLEWDGKILGRDANEVGHWEEVGDGFVGEDKEGGASGDIVISCETKEEDGEERVTVITKGASDWAVILEGMLTTAFSMAGKEFSSNTTWQDK